MGDVLGVIHAAASTVVEVLGVAIGIVAEVEWLGVAAAPDAPSLPQQLLEEATPPTAPVEDSLTVLVTGEEMVVGEPQAATRKP